MANISISEINTTASNLSAEDLILISKKNNDNTYQSAKCKIETLEKHILPCGDCIVTSYYIPEESIIHETGQSIFTFTATKTGFISFDVTNLVATSGNYNLDAITIFMRNNTLNSSQHYNTVSRSYAPKTVDSSFSFVGLFAKGTEFRITIPSSRVIKSTDDAENYTKIKVEITHHDD